MRAFAPSCACPQAIVACVAILALHPAPAAVAQTVAIPATAADGPVLVHTEAFDESVEDAGNGLANATLQNRPTVQVDGKSFGKKSRCCCNACGPCGPCLGGATGDCMGAGTSSGNGTGTSSTGGRVGLTSGQFAGGSQTNTAATLGGGAYLDLPFIVNQFRIRYDDAYDDNAPDRAEYFYAKCGCFGGNAAGPTNAKGGAATLVNYQAIRTYLEKRLSERFSVFAEVPVQFDNIHMNVGSNLQTGGLADMNAGFKYALLARNDRYLTFQLRTYIPTGDSYQGLGTHHVSLEPSLLYWRTLSDRAFIQGQFTDWTPVGGSDFAGNLLEFGGAVGYVAYRRFDPTARSTPYAANLPPQVAPQNWFLVTPLLESVTWTVLGGQKYLPPAAGASSAAGDTISNLKLGVRFTKGYNSIYTGWAHGLTQQIWYRNMFRLEYRRFF